jgi:hypothetical protein
MKKDLLKLTLEAFEKRFKANDYDGSLIESIKNSLKSPLHQLNHHKNSNSSTNGIIHLTPGGFVNPSTLAALKLNQLSSASSTSSVDKSSTIAFLLKQQQQNSTGVNLLQNNLNNNNNKRFKKDGKPISKLLNSTNTVNNNQTKNSSHSSNSDSLSHKQQKLVNEFSSTNNRQNSINSSNSNKKLTVNALTANQLLQQQQPVVSSSTQLLNNRLNELSNLKSLNEKSRRLLMMQRKLNGDASAGETDLLNNKSTDGIMSGSISGGSDQIIDARLAQELSEIKQYTEELKLNNIENLDAVLNETKNHLSTSVEKDGQWCFRRKDGCKYLAVSSFILFFNKKKKRPK